MTTYRRTLFCGTILALGTLPSAPVWALAAPSADPLIVDGGAKPGKVVSSNSQLQAANANIVSTGSQVIGANNNGSVTIGSAGRQTIYTNFITTGGTGAGGGAGAGGAFFVDAGASLRLNNVSFSNNGAVGGQGGGININFVGPTAYNVATIAADGLASRVFLPKVEGLSYNGNGEFTITGFTAVGDNPLIQPGGGVVQRIADSTLTTFVDATVSAITPNGQDNSGNDLFKIELSNAIKISSANVAAGVVGVGGVVLQTPASPIAVQKGQTVYYKKDGVTKTAVVTKVNFNDDGKVESYETNVEIGFNTRVDTPAIQSLEVTRYLATTTDNFTKVLKPAGSLAGFEVGMTVASVLPLGVPPNTTITAVDLNTGEITLSQEVNTHFLTSFKASFNPLISNSGGQSVLQINSVVGLAVGQGVSGTGVPTGTKIAAIDVQTKQITLDKELTKAGVDAITLGRQQIVNDPVLSVDTGAKTVSLVSVKGLSVGSLLFGDISIPPNAVITAINPDTNVVTYRIDPLAAQIAKGGALNGLKAFGTPSLSGEDGKTGSIYSAIFDNGEGSIGTNGGNGIAGVNAAGGNGGGGGSGTNGSAFNTGLVTTVIFTAQNLASNFIKAGTNFAGVFTIPAGLSEIIQAILTARDLVKGIVQLAAWQVSEKQGLVALGGSGGNGGNGGSATDFFGGGAGGSGGLGGRGAETYTIGGGGGSGGSGGNGGFGAGGGQGGVGGVPGPNGTYGSSGAGGQGGFGGGVGSTFILGGSGDKPISFGGGGGSGMGGAIFVRAGGTLEIFGDAAFQNNSAYGGSSNNRGAAGQSAGSDLFIMTGANVLLSPGTGKTITFNGAIADDSATSLSNAYIATGQGASLKIAGGGTVQFFGTNTYSGTTEIAGATLEAQDGVGINANSMILFSGTGTIGAGITAENAGVLLSGGSFTRSVGNRSNNLQWTGSGGFAAQAGGLTVTLGAVNGVGQQLNWDAGNFVGAGSTLVFGSDAVNATGTVTFQNAINLNNNDAKIAVFHNAGSMTNGTTSYDAVMSGAITRGTLTVNDAGYSGSLLLTSLFNNLSGVTLNGGTLSTTNGTTIGTLMNQTTGGFVTVNGGTLLIGGGEKLTTVDIKAPGVLMAGGPTTADDITNVGTLTFMSSLVANSITNSGMLNLLGPSRVTAAVSNAANGLVMQMGTLNAGPVTNNGSWFMKADLTANGTLTNNGTLTVVGNTSGSPVVETSATRTLDTAGLSGSGIINLGGLSGNVANTLLLNQSSISVYTGRFTGAGGLTKTGQGYLMLRGASDFTGPLNINAGVIDTSNGGTFADTLDVTVERSGVYLVGTNDTIRSIVNRGVVQVDAALTLATLTSSAGANAVVNGSLIASGNVSNAGTMSFASGSTGTLSAMLTNSTGGTLTSQGTLSVTGLFTNEAGATTTLGSAGSSTFGSLSNAGTLTASSPLTVTGAVTNAANATMTLNAGSRPQFGSLTNAGTIAAKDATNVSGAYVQNTGSLTTSNNASLTTGSFSGSGGAVVLNGTSLFTINQSADGTYSGTVSGTGTVVKQGNATLTLAGAAASFAPSLLTVRTGQVIVQNASILGSALPVTTDAAGTLTLLANQSIARLLNNGTTNLQADLTTSGTVTNNGTLNVIGTLAGTPAVETAATRTITTAGFAGSGTANLGGLGGTTANTLVINQSGGSLYSGTFTGAGALTKTGVGTLTVTGASSFTGPLTVNGGTLDTTGGGTMADSIDVTMARGASYIVGSNDTIRSVTNNGTTIVNAALTLATLTNNATGTATVNGSLTASGLVANTGTMRFAAGSTGTLAADLNNSGNGTLTSQGTLSVAGLFSNDSNATANFGSAGSSIFGSLSNAGTLTASSPFSVTGAATNSGTMTLNTGSTPQFGSLTNSGTIAANDSTMVSGAYTQNAGSLTTGNNANLTTGSFSGAGGDVVLNGTSLFTINQAADGSYAGTVSGTGTVLKQGNATLTLTGGTGSFAPSALTVRTGQIVVQNAGILGGALPITTDAAGTLTLLANQSIASLLNNGTTNLVADLTTSGTTTNNGTLNVIGTIAARATTDTAATRTLTTAGFAGTGTTNLGGVSGTTANTLIINQSGASLYSGTFTGVGGLTKAGAGTLTLTGASSFTGPLAINAGTLDTTGGGTLADTLDVTVARGATYVIGTRDTIRSLTNSGTTNANAGLTLATLTTTAGGTTNINTALTSSGNVGNAGTLNFAARTTGSIGGNLANSGTLASQAVLTVAGSVTNDSGATATLGSGGASTFGSLVNNGQLTVSSPLTVTGAVTNGATGVLTLGAGATPALGSLANSGTVTSADLLNIAGAYVQNAGSLTVTQGLASGSLSGSGGTIRLDNASAFVLNQTSDGTYAGSITGTGGVLKYGNANLTISGGANSFSPASLSIFAGQVIVTTAGALNQALQVAVNGGALTLQAAQTINNLTGSGTVNLGTNNLTLAQGGNFSGTINGTGAVQLASGTFTLNSALNNPGGTFGVQTGSTFNVGNTGSITTSVLNINGGRLNLNSTATATTTNITNGGILRLGNGINIGVTGAGNGTLNSGTLNINSGGQLTGNGTVNGNVVVGGGSTGIVSPGNSPGIITVNNITFDNFSFAAMEVEGAAGPGLAGGNDLLVVNGSLTLKAGSTLAIAKSALPNSFELALGQRIQLFRFAPGAVSGQFGSASSTGFTRNMIFNIGTGSLIGLGSNSTAQFEAALGTSPNASALINTLRVSTSGGINQYYGGNLMGYAASALATGAPGAVEGAFARWSPEAYIGLSDQMKQSVLDNLPAAPSYAKLEAGRVYATGNINRNGMKGSSLAGYARNSFRDTAFNIGFAYQFGFAEISLAYGHTDGSVNGDYLRGTQNGEQVIAGLSIPVALDQKLRLTGDFIYGDYSAHGTRVTNTGTANATGLSGHTTAYAFGLAYRQQGKTLVDVSAKVIGMDQVQNGFSETAATLGGASTLDLQRIADIRRSAWVGRFDAKLGTNLMANTVAYVDVTYERELGKELTPMTGNLTVESLTWTIANPGLARDRLLGGIGARIDITPSLQLNLDARGGINSAYNFGGGVRLRF